MSWFDAVTPNNGDLPEVAPGAPPVEPMIERPAPRTFRPRAEVEAEAVRNLVRQALDALGFENMPGLRLVRDKELRPRLWIGSLSIEDSFRLHGDILVPAAFARGIKLKLPTPTT